MALTEKQKEDLAARKAINEAKRAKKPATKVVKKKPVEATKTLAEQIEAENPTTETEIPPEVVANSGYAMDELVALSQETEQELLVKLDNDIRTTIQSTLKQGGGFDEVEAALLNVLSPFISENMQHKVVVPRLEELSQEDRDSRKLGIKVIMSAPNGVTEVLDKVLSEFDFNEPSQEAPVDVLEQEATNVLPEGENVSTAPVDSLEVVKEGQFKVTSEELSEIAKKSTELLLNATPEQLSEYGKHSEHFEITPDCSIDFTNGRSKPAVSTQIGGYNTQEGTYFNKMMQEVVYILTLGGKFDRSVAPRFSGLPFSCKMKIPVDKYSDYVNRVRYPDYEVDKETYKVSLSAPDFRVLLNSLEKYVESGWEIDPKKAVMYKGRYVIPFRLRFPVEITAGLHCKVRTPIKYTVEELRAMEWGQVRAIANLHGIEETNHNAVISQLMTIMENIDG